VISEQTNERHIPDGIRCKLRVKLLFIGFLFVIGSLLFTDSLLFITLKPRVTEEGFLNSSSCG
jgi:hypothetical protein